MKTACHRTGLATVILVALVASTAPATAQSVRVAATGEADSRARAARTQALDMAFAEAVSQVIANLVPADVRARYQEAITAQIIRRSRRYIRSYRVVEETTAENVVRVRITAQVNRAQVRDKLAAIGVAGLAVASEDTDRPALAGQGRPKVAVIMRVAVDGNSVLTIGAEADSGGPCAREMVRLLREQRFDVVNTSGLAMPDGYGGGDNGVPVDDGMAGLLAQEAGASSAFVVGVEIRGAGNIRGTSLMGATAQAAIHVVDAAEVAPRLVARARVTGAGFALTDTEALALAAAEVGRKAFAAVADAATAYWPPGISADGALLIDVQGYAGWQNVDAIIRHLTRTRGIERAWPRRVGAEGVTLAVDTDLSQRRVISALRRAPVAAVDVDVDETDTGLTVTLRPIPVPEADESAPDARRTRP